METKVYDVKHPIKRPLATAAVLWTAGTALGGELPQGLLSWKAFMLSVALGVMLALFAIPGRRIIGLLLVVMAAAAYYQIYDAKNVPTIPMPSVVETESGDPAAGSVGREVRLTGEIASRVEVDGDKVSFALRSQAVRLDEEEPLQASDTVQVSVRLLQQEEQVRARTMGRGDPVTVSGVLKRPDLPRNFGGFDYRLYLYRNHIHWQLSAKGLDSVLTEAEADEEEVEGSLLAERRNRFAFVPEPVRIMRWNDDLRSRLGAVFDSLFPMGGPDSGYLKSLVIGLTDDMDPELYRHFSQLGLTHILAISGLHVGVFVAGCMWLLRLFGLTRERILTVTLLLVPFYVAIAGGSPSAVRAGIMAMIGLYAARRLLWKDAPNVIGLAAILMLLWEPYFLYNVSFQLSFLVTTGLIVGVQRFSRLLPIRNKSVSSLLSITIVAQVISFPVTVYYFNGISLLSMLANLVMVPFISFVVLPLGTFALLAGLVSVHAGAPFGWIVEKVNRLTFWLIDYAATHDPSQFIWPKPSIAWIVAYYGLLAAVYAGAIRWKEEQKPLLAYAAVPLMMALLWFGYNPDMLDRDGKVSFIDVGQGDAILIRTPQQRHVLIDGGGTLSFRKPGEEWKERSDPYEVGKKLLVPLLKQRGVHRIDQLVISHQDQDHIGGLQAVVEQIPVTTIVMNGTWKGNASSRKLFETAMRKGTAIVSIAPGGLTPVDRYTKLTVLSSGGGKPTRVAEEQNNESVVLLLQMRDARFLFTGDMRAEDEKELLAAWQTAAAEEEVPEPVDVMKIAHHGSKTSSSGEWLSYWKPERAVISVGLNNSYGHPNAGVLERIAEAGSVIYRTDRSGEIVFTVTRTGLTVDSKL
ncbi:DNA internalization-related competence protein ComEC/Rec2 [Paenibacillus ginsengarvi]|uniref:DNA internalization-related competence protein ComEC/Rec2 n=1 Tax=Paenibacillus ginsengarvi TaxID=400777 RepID=A0A3B0C0N2_9BACL|nr:DNA internalization-related competence protein ComEC/Rec2 [Paenibacillus ginsengarvi]RKN79032.1 DNA internalization-related competence protein ComEC/Rec2 [Paenibacillus ginsengarvi]